jgi:hypothetical protein
MVAPAQTPAPTPAPAIPTHLDVAREVLAVITKAGPVFDLYWEQIPPDTQEVILNHWAAIIEREIVNTDRDLRNPKIERAAVDKIVSDICSRKDLRAAWKEIGFSDRRGVKSDACKAIRDFVHQAYSTMLRL